MMFFSKILAPKDTPSSFKSSVCSLENACPLILLAEDEMVQEYTYTETVYSVEPIGLQDKLATIIE